MSTTRSASSSGGAKESQRLFGPAASILEVARALVAKRDPFAPIAVLFDGDPGIGKTRLADQLALELTASPHAIETVNGQSLGVDLVREWRERRAGSRRLRANSR